MTSLFGVPIDTLVVVLGVMFGIVVAVMIALAARNPILLRLGLRKIPRSWGRSALIVVGLMLGTTIIAAALTTGDTMSHTFRSTARISLGHIDEMVASARLEEGAGESTSDAYFEEEIFDAVLAATADFEAVDGVAPAIIEPLVLQNPASGRSEPRATLFAADPARMEGFGVIRTLDGAAVTLGDLRPGEVYLNEEAAEELDAAPGHELRVLAGGEPVTVRVAAVVKYEGSGTADAAVLLPLQAAQELLNVPGKVNRILVSNAGGPLDGIRHTDTVIDRLTPVLEGTGLAVHPVKQDAMELADEMAVSLTSLFTTFGMFSIVAGVLLIFLLFIMLAAERRPEMGIARAVGTQRGQVVRMFLYEGLAYDLLAAAVGAVAGVGVAFVMVFALARAYGGLGVEIRLDVRFASLAVAYLLGVFLTLATVAISAYRASSLNIVAAIRNLPDRPQAGHRRRRWWLGPAAMVLGALIAYASFAGGQNYATVSIGVTLIAGGTVPVLRRLDVPERLAFTIPGLVILVWYLLPFSVLEVILPDLATDFSAFVLGGVAVVVAATLVIMFNADLVVAMVMNTAGLVRALAPVLKTAVSRPLANRFRTGTTIAMFGLVVLTVVLTSAIRTAIDNSLNDVESFGGGFDLRATVLNAGSVEDMPAAIADTGQVDASSFESIAAQSTLVLEAYQAGSSRDFEKFPVFGFDDDFLAASPYKFSSRAKGYESDAAVWEAMRDRPNLAVVTSLVVPARAGFSFGVLPDFRLEGFYLEDREFDPVNVEVRDPQSGQSTTLTIVGVLSIVAPQEFLAGILTNQQAVATFGDQARPTVYWMALNEGSAAENVATGLEAAFVSQGMEVDVMQEALDEMMASNRTFMYLFQGFLGLGLIVGVAGLAVISARSVVERRRDLAVLRSIGFQRWMVYMLVLVETSFIALTGILLGFVLGLFISYSLVRDLATDPGWSNLEFALPWLNLAIIFFTVYLAAVLTSLAPARRAANVYPAEALRYE